MSSNLLSNIFAGRAVKRPAFWFMRQAGRYLPEYREIRSSSGGFLDLCYSPEKAMEVTLQPLRRFGMDAVIIFSDILVIPHAMGLDLRFAEGEGPILSPVATVSALQKLSFEIDYLEPVYEAIRLTKAQLSDETSLIGFAGAPWTLACYMVQGKSDKDFGYVRDVAAADPVFFAQLSDKLVDAVIKHCCKQIEAGADIIQIFDSWAGVLDAELFRKWSIEPTQKIVAGIRKMHPSVPIIGFPRQVGEKSLEYVRQVQVNAVSVDGSVSLEWMRDVLQEECIVQGVLDPVLLAGDPEAILKQARKIISMLANKPFIFNLSHGILPHTPVENVRILCDFLKQIDIHSYRHPV